MPTPCKICKTRFANSRYYGHCKECWTESTPKEWNKHQKHRRPTVFLPKQPTEAMPGTEEKIEVLTQRVTNNEPLWHPLDAGMDLMC